MASRAQTESRLLYRGRLLTFLVDPVPMWWAGTDPANGACRMLWGLLVSISLNQQAISALTRK
jgi:hypothetical protein